MSKSTDLLLGRRRELHQLIEDAVKSYTAEIEQIDNMLLVAGVGVRVRSRLREDVAAKDESSEPRNVKEQVLAVLADHPEGLTTREIAEKVNLRFGRKIKSRNMSWHVSHLKGSGELTLESNLWSIPSKQERLELDDAEKEDTNQAAE